MSFRPTRRNPLDRKTLAVAFGDPSTKSLRDFAFGTAQDDNFGAGRILLMSFRPTRRNPLDRKAFAVALGDPSTICWRKFAFRRPLRMTILEQGKSFWCHSDQRGGIPLIGKLWLLHRSGWQFSYIVNLSPFYSATSIFLISCKKLYRSAYWLQQWRSFVAIRLGENHW